MSLQVQGQMVGASECPLTVWTLERLHPGVLAHVPGELIGASKLPVTALPVALVWFLPGVGSLVGFEVRALGVDLGAPRVGAPVDTLVALGLGVVVDCIHQLVWAELWGNTASHQVGELLDGRGRAGGGRADWVMVERGG